MFREELPDMTEASLAMGAWIWRLTWSVLQPAKVAMAAVRPNTRSVRRIDVRCMFKPWGMCDQGSVPVQAELELMEEVKMPELDCCELRTWSVVPPLAAT